MGPCYVDDGRALLFAVPHFKVEFFQRCFGAIRQFVQLSPIGHLACWRRRMDTAFLDELPRAVSTPDSQVHHGPGDLEPILNPVLVQKDLLACVLHPLLHVPACRGIPAEEFEGRKTVWILHLFSGRRRVGDCHWWLEHIGHLLWPEVQMKMISLDTAVHLSLGNLAKGSNFDKVKKIAQSGRIAGVLTGPPCETWSAARHQQTEQCLGPRPLRSAELSWCLPQRTDKELTQCAIGTELLVNSLTVETATVLNGGASIMEHPWENGDEDKASVWRTDIHQQWVMALPNAHRHYVEQYLFGAAGVKPTCLRALNLGEPALTTAVLQEGMEPWRVKPSIQLIGRDASGRYRTAAAKEYSSALCRTMLISLVKGLRDRARTEGFRLAPACAQQERQWMQDAWSASCVYTRESFLPDYQG